MSASSRPLGAGVERSMESSVVTAQAPEKVEYWGRDELAALMALRIALR